MKKNNSALYLFFVILFSAILPTTAYAQWVPEEIKSHPKINEADDDKFSIDADITGFFKNNEYFNSISKGETFPGIRFIPKLGYQIGGKGGHFRAELGAVGQYYSGDQQKKGFRPFNEIFARLQYSIQPNLHLTLGNYHGGVNHRLIEPIYKWERHYTEKLESGLQLMYEDKKYFLDAWIDWQRFIERGDSIPEILTFGVSSSMKLSKPESRWQFSIPLQLLIHHQGGQIDNSSEKMIVAGNLVTGICSEVAVGDKFVKSMGFELYAVGYYDKLPHKAVRPYSQGWGVYPVIKVNAKDFKFMTGYWYAQHFFAYGGEPLFASSNPDYPDDKLPRRGVLTVKGAYSRHLFSVFSIGGQAEAYADMKSGKIDYSFGIQLRADLRIWTK